MVYFINVELQNIKIIKKNFKSLRDEVRFVDDAALMHQFL